MVFYSNGEPIQDVVSPFPIYGLTSDSSQKTGGSVFALCKSIPSLGWHWNQSAIVSIALLGHTAKEDTLHKGIRRLPPNDSDAEITRLDICHCDASDVVEKALRILISSIKRA